MTTQVDHVGVVAAGAYVPATSISAADIAAATGIPEPIIRDKFGIHKKPIPGPDDHSNAMALRAAQDAVARAGIDPAEIDLVLCTTGRPEDVALLLGRGQPVVSVAPRNDIDTLARLLRAGATEVISPPLAIDETVRKLRKARRKALRVRGS